MYVVSDNTFTQLMHDAQPDRPPAAGAVKGVGYVQTTCTSKHLTCTYSV